MSAQNDLNQIKEKISEIEEKSADGVFIYRGEPEHFKERYDGKVSSNLWREYRIEGDHFDIEIVQTEMLDAAKKHTGDPPQQFLADLAASLNVTEKYIGETTDFEILTEIQHYGGKTNLIDFTTDYLIALFFACDGSHDKNGRIILLQRTEEKNKKYQIEEPKNPRNRVISQKSVFVRPFKGYVETEDCEMINIPKSLKQTMLTHLRKYHSISTETIYNDLHGFIRNQDIHGDAYTQFYRGFACQNRGDEATTSETKKKEYEKSIKYYTNAIELKPDFANAYNNRGNVYTDKGELDNAIRDYTIAIQLRPNFADAYNNRGTAYDKKGEVERAIRDYTKAIELKPNGADAYKNRAMACDDRGNWGNAVDDYTKVIELKPDDAQAYSNRGIARAFIRDFVLAIRDSNKAIELKPDNADFYNNRGVVYIHQEDLDCALRDYNKAIELNPGHIYAYYNRGVVYQKQDEADSAIENYNKAIELNLDNAKAYYKRGTAWLQLREWEKAKTDLTAAVKKGFEIGYRFRFDYKGIPGFEEKYGELPEDILAMLTPPQT